MKSSILVSLLAALALTACAGDDADSGGAKLACNLDDSCFDTEGWNPGAVKGTCDNLEGTLADGCDGPRAGCCQHGGITQCFYGDADAGALADICASQSGTWTPG